MNELALASSAQQFVAKLRVRDMNQSHGSFADCFAMQLRHSILSHDVVDVGARSDYTCARLQPSHYSRHRSIVRGGTKRDDRFAALAPSRAPDEINLSAKTAVEAVAN